MFVVSPDLVIYEDRDDAVYIDSFRTFKGPRAEREAIEYVLCKLPARERRLRERLRGLPLLFPVGTRVMAEGMEAIVVKQDNTSMYPYLLFFPSTLGHDWYEETNVFSLPTEVEPCPSSE